MDDTITDDELAELVSRTEEAAVAYVRGDMERYLDITHHDRGYTLLPPNGGPASRHEDRDAGLRSSPSLFTGGEARLEHVETHAWGDTVVLIMIERQHGQIRGMADQDCSLRVTHVYRREDSQWRLVHRHADPMVSQISLDRLTSLMRG